MADHFRLIITLTIAVASFSAMAATSGSSSGEGGECPVQRVLIIGANGNIGRRLAALLREHPRYKPLAMIRDAKQKAAFDALGVPTVLADLEYPIDHAMVGVHAVVFTAGSGDDAKSGRDKNVLVDHIGAIRAVVAAQMSESTTRFIMVSATNADVNSQSAIAYYHRAKAHADNYIRDHATFGPELDWTIFAPSRLHDEPPTGLIEVGPETAVSREDPTITDRGGVHRPGARTGRANVAATIMAALPLASTHRKTLRLLDGDLPIEAALQAA
jgi:uncharacterized protein YbjT (DUF2867 family)